MPSTWKVMLVDEVLAVRRYLKRRGRERDILNLMVFHLAVGCGLRRSEIAKLKRRDVLTGGPRPVILIRPENAKRHRGRTVPMWWDSVAMEELSVWRHLDHPNAPMVPRLNSADRWAHPIPETVSRRWSNAMKCLPETRAKMLTIHCGRHTFISHALHNGRTLAEVADAVGHRNIATTSIYAHLIESEDIPDLYSKRKPINEHDQCHEHRTY